MSCPHSNDVSNTDLCVLTGLPPAGLLCELVNDDLQGSMARRDDCRDFADRYGFFSYVNIIANVCLQMGN